MRCGSPAGAGATSSGSPPSKGLEGIEVWLRGGAALLVALVAATGCGVVEAQAPAAGTGPTITVQGHGEVPVPASMATFSAGVQTTAATAAAALSRNNAVMAAVVQAVEKAGVPAKDLTTTDLEVDPQYSYRNGEAPVLTGYQATQTDQVQVADAADAGAVIDAASGAGANRLGSISFGPPPGDALTVQAMAAAVADAHAQAEAIAKAAGLTLGAVLSVTPVQRSTTPPVFAQSVAAVPAASTQVQTGSQQVQAEVQVTFAAQ